MKGTRSEADRKKMRGKSKEVKEKNARKCGGLAFWKSLRGEQITERREERAQARAAREKVQFNPNALS